MNIKPRTCANCTSFDPTDADDATCSNMVSITQGMADQPDVHRRPNADDCCDHHQTADEAVLERYPSKANIAFLAAALKFMELSEALGAEHPEANKAFMLVLSLAPQRLVDRLNKINFTPTPDAYTREGEAIFELSTIATSLGISTVETRQLFEELALTPVMLDPATVHRVQ